MKGYESQFDPPVHLRSKVDDEYGQDKKMKCRHKLCVILEILVSHYLPPILRLIVPEPNLPTNVLELGYSAAWTKTLVRQYPDTTIRIRLRRVTKWLKHPGEVKSSRRAMPPWL